MQRFIIFSPPDAQLSDPAYRTFLVPKTLLLKHTTGLHDELTNQTVEDPITLPETDYVTFRDFVDFLHSSIYSTRTSIPSFQPVSAYTRAYVLGGMLGCKTFREAALYKLYHAITQNRGQDAISLERSVIRPTDLEYVVETTPRASAVHRLLIHGMLSHATWGERLELATVQGKKVEGELSWQDCCLKFSHVFTILLTTLHIRHEDLRGIVRGIDEYIEMDRIGDREKERREEVVEAVGSSQVEWAREKEEESETDGSSESSGTVCCTPTTEEGGSAQEETVDDDQREAVTPPGSDVE